jgi:hypothetical protein
MGEQDLVSKIHPLTIEQARKLFNGCKVIYCGREKSRGPCIGGEYYIDNVSSKIKIRGFDRKFHIKDFALPPISERELIEFRRQIASMDHFPEELIEKSLYQKIKEKTKSIKDYILSRLAIYLV